MIEIRYEEGLATRTVFPEKGTEIVTDAPKEVGGLERTFSPTDLLAIALGSCVLTLMGMAARRLHVDLKGMRLEVTKGMSSKPPRRISEVHLDIYCPSLFSPEVTEELVRAAKGCPVAESLHPDVHKEFVFHWGAS
ncbi:MAG: OsmC family protein [Verrucomicrobia bacterium]|nr:OsmC family protein [Verrucomicrobiota bacterium]